MKQWDIPELIELKISETSHDWFGCHHDGGYFGDGQISGHLSFGSSDQTPSTTPTPNPNPTNPLS